MTAETGILIWIVLALFQVLLLRFLRTIKYQKAPWRKPSTIGDYGSAVLISGWLITLRVYVPFWGGLFGAALGCFLFLLLWLDAALYSIFTFELGAGGVAGVVLSNLVREVLQMRRARSFFRTHLRFTLFPAAALASHLFLILGPEPASFGRIILLGGLAAYLLSTLLFNDNDLDAARQDANHPALQNRRALLHDFLVDRRPRIAPEFQPRPEHTPLIRLLPALPSPSAEHGILADASVVLLTFESLGAAHLLAADAPFARALEQSASSVVSSYHFCIAPLTNAAHIAIYASNYVATGTAWAPTALRQAGYQTIYLTAANVKHYGLGAILRQAGFMHIVDANTMRDGRATDYDLLSEGMQRVRTLAQSHGGPFFLHVHAANTHLPYHVVNSQRFGRYPMSSDRGRFLNGIAETDWIWSQLWAMLRELPGRVPPLLLLSSDHGQAFGEQGYFSHGNAVIKEELNVPLFLQHPRLAPRTVQFSTHFDLMPTVLDLVGISAVEPGFGQSIFAADRSPGHLLWDGQPSRRTSGCLGLLFENRKYALDLVRGTCVQSDWEDHNLGPLCKEEQSYFESLLGILAHRRGLQ